MSDNSKIWSVGYSNEDGEWQVRTRYSDEPNSQELIEESLGSNLLSAALDIDGTIYKDPLTGETTRTFETVPWVFIVTASGNLYAKKVQEPMNTATLLDTNVTQVSARRSYKRLVPFADWGLIVAYVKSNGSVVCKAGTGLTETVSWSGAKIVDPGPATHAQVVRLPDTRTGILVRKGNALNPATADMLYVTSQDPLESEVEIQLFHGTPTATTQSGSLSITTFEITGSTETARAIELFDVLAEAWDWEEIDTNRLIWGNFALSRSNERIYRDYKTAYGNWTGVSSSYIVSSVGAGSAAIIKTAKTLMVKFPYSYTSTYTECILILSKVKELSGEEHDFLCYVHGDQTKLVIEPAVYNNFDARVGGVNNGFLWYNSWPIASTSEDCLVPLTQLYSSPNLRVYSDELYVTTDATDKGRIGLYDVGGNSFYYIYRLALLGKVSIPRIEPNYLLDTPIPQSRTDSIERINIGSFRYDNTGCLHTLSTMWNWDSVETDYLHWGCFDMRTNGNSGVCGGVSGSTQPWPNYSWSVGGTCWVVRYKQVFMLETASAGSHTGSLIYCTIKDKNGVNRKCFICLNREIQNNWYLWVGVDDGGTAQLYTAPTTISKPSGNPLALLLSLFQNSTDNTYVSDMLFVLRVFTSDLVAQRSYKIGNNQLYLAGPIAILDTNRYTDKDIAGNLPLSVKTPGYSLIDYTIYGTAAGAGVATESEEPAGYKIPITVTCGSDSTTIPIYLGATKLGLNEYIHYSEGKIYRLTDQGTITLEQGTIDDAGVPASSSTQVRSDVSGVLTLTAGTYVLDAQTTEDQTIQGELQFYQSNAAISENTWVSLSRFQTLPYTFKLTATSYVALVFKNVSGDTMTPSQITPSLGLQAAETPVPALAEITTYNGENTISSSQTLGSVEIKYRG